MSKATIEPKSGDTDAYLIVPQENQKPVVEENTIWCKINEDNELELIRWDIINIYAAQYDADKNARDQTRVMCKLLTLVRDQVRKEMTRE